MDSHIAIDDRYTVNILKHFPTAIDFILQAQAEGGNVLVHCMAGVSRSASIVIAYLMREKGMDYETAFAFTGSRRMVLPNSGFQNQLIEYHRQLKKKSL